MRTNVLRSVVLFMTLLLASASSFAYDVEIDGIYYNIDKETRTAEVTYNKLYNQSYYASTITIPSSVTIDGAAYSVTKIGDNAFMYCNSLTSVSIPNSVTSIGESAFGSCESLTSIDIPNSVTSIGYCAFICCYSLTSVKLSESLTRLGSEAFRRCLSLTSIDIPNSVTNIGGATFDGCTSLTSVSIGNSVTNIVDEMAFYNCTSLTSISFGSSMERIGENAFRTCRNIKEIYSLNPTPPSLYMYRGSCWVFGNYSATLYVPEESMKQYHVAAGWSEFKDIRPIGGTSSIEQVTSSQPSVLYDLSGKEATAPRPGQIVIKKLGGKTVKYRR